MSKFLIVNDGDYTLKVRDGGNITLNTGVNSGAVTITGDLIVEGDTTTINTQELTVEDKIIRVNNNDASPFGVTSPGTGIEFFNGRNGSFGGDAMPQFLFTNDFGYESPTGEVTGGFIFKTKGGNNLIGIRTHNVSSDTSLILQPGGLGVVKVNKANYETFLSDDDDIPNKKYVDDEINAVVIGAAFPRITDGDSEMRVYDDSSTGVDSRIETKIDNVLTSFISKNYFDVYSTTINLNEIRIEQNQITTTASNDDLVLSAPGTGSVKVQDSMVITNRPSVLDPLEDPLYTTEGVKLYAKNPGTGDSGLFFVNTNNDRDELISKQRALVFSHMF